MASCTHALIDVAVVHSVDMVGWNPSLTSEPPSSASPKGGDTVPLRGGRSRGLSVGETDEPFLSVQGVSLTQ